MAEPRLRAALGHHPEGLPVGHPEGVRQVAGEARQVAVHPSSGAGEAVAQSARNA